MNEDEDIAAYILQVDQLVNTIRGLGEEVEETIVVRKILRTLPKRVQPQDLCLRRKNRSKDYDSGSIIMGF